jgi:hypothetical protein
MTRTWRKLRSEEYVQCDECERAAVWVEVDSDVAARVTPHDFALPPWFVRGAVRAACARHFAWVRPVTGNG